MALFSWLLVSMGGRRSQRPGPSPTLGSLRPLTSGVTSPRCHSGVPLVPMVLWALLMKRCMTNGMMKILYIECHKEIGGNSRVTWWNLVCFGLHQPMLLRFLHTNMHFQGWQLLITSTPTWSSYISHGFWIAQCSTTFTQALLHTST